MSNYAEIWNQIERSRCKPIPFKDELTTPQFTGEPTMTDKEQAVKKATDSGAVQAWLCGQDIQWRVAADRNGTWKDFDRGGSPDFTSLTTEWRSSPIKDPEIKWFAIKDCEPQHGQRCLISDGEVVHFDRWEGDDWKKRGKAYYPHWSPLPKPAKVLK